MYFIDRLLFIWIRRRYHICFCLFVCKGVGARRLPWSSSHLPPQSFLLSFLSLFSPPKTTKVPARKKCQWGHRFCAGASKNGHGGHKQGHGGYKKDAKKRSRLQKTKARKLLVSREDNPSHEDTLKSRPLGKCVVICTVSCHTFWYYFPLTPPYLNHLTITYRSEVSTLLLNIGNWYQSSGWEGRWIVRQISFNCALLSASQSRGIYDVSSLISVALKQVH